MLVGAVPFYNKNQNILFNNILEKDVVFREEDMLSDNAKTLIRGVSVPPCSFSPKIPTKGWVPSLQMRSSHTRGSRE
jgi:hypothetical protein